ncbi:MAG: dATP/dGTP pyrophosphohydrolase domain-containing protein [Elsteraceae bacterium]
MVDGYEFAPGWVEDTIPVLTFTTPEGERGHLSMPLALALCAFFLERHGPKFDLVAHLHRQRDFSLNTFGPGLRTKGVVDHIKKELKEILADPTDHREWIDVIILGFDGLLRTGIDPTEAVAEWVAKQTKNEGRNWPDWRTADPNKAIEHDRSKDAPTVACISDEGSGP